jgi:IMP dehydrogenase
MAKIIGDYTGTTWSDFVVLTEWKKGRKAFAFEDVDLSVDIAGVHLGLPFFAAAMRSVVDEELALAAGRLNMMAVAPRGLNIDRQRRIVEHVKKNAVDVGCIESEYKPTTAMNDEKLGSVIETARRSGYSNIPIIDRKAVLVGMLHYVPSKHDNMDLGMPITDVMEHYDVKSLHSRKVCSSDMGDEKIRIYMRKHGLRMVSVVDGVVRLERLVFLQETDGYKVGAAIDTHPGWEKRIEAVVEAGADMIFTDTSDAYKPFAADVIKRYKKMGRKMPPICGGNVITPGGFDYVVDAGADLVKLGMGPGSICTTNEVLGVGAPPFWSLVEVAKRRNALARHGVYIPLIADGGIEGPADMTVALTHADAIMGGKVFGCFKESAGDRIDREGRIHRKDDGMGDSDIVGIKLYGEGSREARETTGDLRRYATPGSNGVATYQGVSGVTKYRGRAKPGVEGYAGALREALWHAGAENLAEYRKMATLLRMSEMAKQTAAPHGIDILRN